MKPPSHTIRITLSRIVQIDVVRRRESQRKREKDGSQVLNNWGEVRQS